MSHLPNSAIWRIKFKFHSWMAVWHCHIFKTYPPDKLDKLRTTGPRIVQICVAMPYLNTLNINALIHVI